MPLVLWDYVLWIVVSVDKIVPCELWAQNEDSYVGLS